MQPVYAVELDDATHDIPKRQMRDKGVERMLLKANLPLVRFRDVKNMTNNQITQKFEYAATNIR